MPPPTATPTIVSGALCGDGIVQGTETCDDGGTCWNGPNAGMRCPATVAGGVDCAAPGSCRPAGGDGCAENCTVETTVDFPLGDAETSQSFNLVTADAFSVSASIYGRVAFRAGQPRADLVETTAGKVFNPGDIPVVETVLDNRWTPEQSDRGIAPVAVQPGIACACIRGFAVKTCGGVPDGADCSPKCADASGSKLCAGGSNPLESCTSDQDCPNGSCGQPCNPDLGDAQCGEGFSCTSQDDLCTGDRACDFVYGPGNQASGVIGCGATGLADIDYTIAAQGIRTFSGGPTASGSALISTSSAFGSITNSTCEFDGTQVLNGPDGLPCTDDDLDKGSSIAILFTTGTASVFDSIGPLEQASSPIICADPPCTFVSGAPFMCSALQQAPPSSAGAALAAAYFEQDVSPLVSVPVLFKLVSTEPTPQPVLTPTPE